MAIALDTSTDLGNASATSLTAAHTCTGTNLLLFVLAMAASDLITGTTYNTIAMTLITKQALSGGNEIYLYALNSPATGANNVVISASGSTTLKGMSISYTGAQNSVAMDAFNQAAAASIGSGSWTGVANTVVGSNCWQINGAIKSAVGIPAASSNCVTRKNAAGICLCDSNGIVSAGSRTQSVNAFDGTQNWAHIAASFGPYVAPTTNYVSGNKIQNMQNLQNIKRLG